MNHRECIAVDINEMIFYVELFIVHSNSFRHKFGTINDKSALKNMAHSKAHNHVH